MALMCHGPHVSWPSCVMALMCRGPHVSWPSCVVALMCHGPHVSWPSCVVALMCHCPHVSWPSCFVAAVDVAPPPTPTPAGLSPPTPVSETYGRSTTGACALVDDPPSLHHGCTPSSRPSTAALLPACTPACLLNSQFFLSSPAHLRLLSTRGVCIVYTCNGAILLGHGSGSSICFAVVVAMPLIM